MLFYLMKTKDKNSNEIYGLFIPTPESPNARNLIK